LRGNPDGGFAQWIIGKVTVSLRGPGLGVTEQAPDDWKAEAATSAYAGEGMTQILDSRVTKAWRKFHAALTGDRLAFGTGRAPA
jgi:hypothetical protein